MVLRGELAAYISGYYSCSLKSTGESVACSGVPVISFFFLLEVLGEVECVDTSVGVIPAFDCRGVIPSLSRVAASVDV